MRCWYHRPAGHAQQSETNEIRFVKAFLYTRFLGRVQGSICNNSYFLGQRTPNKLMRAIITGDAEGHCALKHLEKCRRIFPLTKCWNGLCRATSNAAWTQRTDGGILERSFINYPTHFPFECMQELSHSPAAPAQQCTGCPRQNSWAEHGYLN